jgi:hypothetical protein
MPAPTVHPSQRDPAAIASTDTYHPADRVWVYRTGTWRAGIVEQASPRAATVTYRTGVGGGTGVDTMTAPYVVSRADTDPHLDHSRR